MDDELLRALARIQERRSPPDLPMDVTSDGSAEHDSLPAELTTRFDDAERNAMLDAVFARIDAETAAPSVTRPIAATAKSPRARTVAVLAMALAVAAALVLWIARPTGGESQLPSYALTELRGGASSVRSNPRDLDRVLDLAPGETIELVVTPAIATRAAIVVDLVAHADGRNPVMARVPAQISPSGAVRLTGRLDEWLALAPGEWRITVVVAPVEHAPATAEAALRDESLARLDFRVNIAPAR